MRILMCKKCHKNPRFPYEDLCDDCLPPEVVEQRCAQIRVERDLSDRVEMGNLQWGIPADDEGGDVL